VTNQTSTRGGAGSFARPIEFLLATSKVLGFAILLALSAKLSFPIPGTPVPATLQVLAVLVSGALLGPWGGACSVLTYLAAGIAGAPVFAMGGGPSYLMGPTGGYLIGFLPAAWVAGFLARRARGLWSLFGSFVLASILIHLFGWAQLSALSGPEKALNMGVVPFIAADLLKALLAAALVRSVARRATGEAHG
jgi:biotin transport system substrate-specific component